MVIVGFGFRYRMASQLSFQGAAFCYIYEPHILIVEAYAFDVFVY